MTMLGEHLSHPAMCERGDGTHGDVLDGHTGGLREAGRRQPRVFHR